MEPDHITAIDEPRLEQGLHLMESIIGGRWNPVILFAIEQGASRYSDIRKAIEYISDTELQRKLGSLLQSRLIQKDSDEEDARKTAYALTDFGGDITHTLRHIIDISFKHTNLPALED